MLAGMRNKMYVHAPPFIGITQSGNEVASEVCKVVDCVGPRKSFWRPNPLPRLVHPAKLWHADVEASNFPRFTELEALSRKLWCAKSAKMTRERHSGTLD
jgi:hypothetical protein